MPCGRGGAVVNLREALRTQGPSYALQEAARDEIARLDALVDYNRLYTVLRASGYVTQNQAHDLASDILGQPRD